MDGKHGRFLFFLRLNMSNFNRCVYGMNFNFTGFYFSINGTSQISVTICHIFHLWVKKLSLPHIPTPCVNFINVKLAPFSYERCFDSLFYIHVTRKKLQKWRLYKKLACLTLMKLMAGCHFLSSFTFFSIPILSPDKITRPWRTSLQPDLTRQQQHQRQTPLELSQRVEMIAR